MKIILAVLFVAVSHAAGEGVDLLQKLTPGDVGRLGIKNASVFRDSASGAVTFTFEYTHGEPEVRIPTRALGWPTDWRAYKALQYTFSSTSLEQVAIGFSNGTITKTLSTEPLPNMRIYGVIPFDTFVQTRTMVPILPFGYKAWPSRLFTFERVEEILFKMRQPNEPVQFTLYKLALREDVPADDILDKRPVLDRFGQWIPENWPDKAHSVEQLRALWAADRLTDTEYPFCALGGDTRRAGRRSGFFRVEKNGGKWYFIDPHGHPFFSTGMDLVGYKQGSFATDVRRREYLFASLPTAGPAWLKRGRHVSFYTANIMERFGEGWQAKWQQHIVNRLRNWRFRFVTPGAVIAQTPLDSHALDPAVATAREQRS